ncbi:ImmA/IrrE family metallo-endopeptidase [Solirubrobacter ginsenosidimutans]|uniref:ImmA/IrrE family metallo-endopeptidase n=1 Tax=Solirubrobacter ginsenosidimutans TaxID=490573 RepID=A0A9X3S573_9ACTN|nr:ImmA/IrrE family metallo-endopeptidase [Solirubrobacter ginsenosidimutans]MDA0166559.1 ImmA/IrrE family metallo-endopeptidase [Solirubrobacter ginsenosidimutans]
MKDVEERAEAVLAGLPSYVWDGERLPVPVEDIANSGFGLLVRDVEDLGTAPGAPVLRDGQSLSGLLLPARGEIWVNAAEARQWPPRRRFTIGHELGHWVMHRTGQQALFCRRSKVDETVTLPARDSAAATSGTAVARDIEEEASAFAAALLMPQWLFVREHARCDGDVATLCAAFGSSIAATERRIASLF